MPLAAWLTSSTTLNDLRFLLCSYLWVQRRHLTGFLGPIWPRNYRNLIFVVAIISAIMALFYSHPKAQVYHSAKLSKPFKISSGMRQGCSLSPLIFNLIMEPLAETISSNKNISGLLIGSTDHKINLADDVILMLMKQAPSLAAFQQVLSNFSVISYYKINSTKSFILDLGMPSLLKTTLQDQYPYTWATYSIP